MRNGKQIARKIRALKAARYTKLTLGMPILMAAFSSTARAATDTWTNAAGGVWATGTNWSTGNPPQTGDNATNSLNALITFNATAPAVNSFTTAGAFTISGGTFTGSQAAAASPVNLAGLFTFSGGTLASATTHANGGIDFHGAGQVLQDGGSLTNASGQSATMGATGAIAVGLLDGATFTNAGTFTGSGGAQFFNDGGAASTFANTGTVNITGSFIVGSSLIFSNTGVVKIPAAATLNIGASYNGTPSGTIPVSSGGSLIFSGPFAQPAGLTNNGSITTSGIGSSGAISGPGSLSITGGTLKLNTNTGASAQNSLSISGGNLDINNNHFFVNYGSGPDPIASIGAWIASGYAGGNWNGGGIISSMAQSNSSSYGIGYADSADPGNPAGLPSGQIEIKYTLLGDANLDGAVNGTDFAIMASNFNKATKAGHSGWDEGDFNYDGSINGTDFAELAVNFNKGASQSADATALESFAAANGLLADVPEPACAGIMVMAGLGILRRRQRVLPLSDLKQIKKMSSSTAVVVAGPIRG